MRPVTTWSIGVALVLHVGAAAAVSTISSGPPPREPTKITIRSAPPKKRPPPPPQVATAAPPVIVPPTAPPPPKAPPRAAPAAAPKIAAAPPAPSAPSPAPSGGPQSYGVKLSNGGGAGAALPSGGGGETAPPAPVHKTLGAESATECTDAPVKPTPINVVQPAFTPEAQAAGITGKVRVEITISKTGDVTAARVIAGLGYGLDEAALAAAKASTFSAATKCGEPVETTFTIGMRFQN